MQKRILEIFLVVALVLITPNSLWAAPNIGNVNGNLIDGENIVIAGSDFGNGPIVEVFDNFNDDIVGSQPNFNATVGTWTGWNSTSYIPAIIEGWNGKKALSVYDGGVARGLQKIFANPTTESFVSLSIYNPDYFPGYLTTNPYIYPYQQFQHVRSAWKMAWLMNTDSGNNNNQDLVVPFTYIGGFATAGNHTPWVWYHKNSIENPNDWYSFSNWMRISWWGRAGNNPTVDNGQAWTQVIKDGIMQDSESGSGVLFNSAYEPQWDRIKIPGWFASGIESSADMTIGYSDIYVATGPNAQARVEICNDQIYANATRCSIQPSLMWSSEEISVKVNLGTFDLGDNAYLFVFNRDGSDNANGYPVIFASGQDIGPPTAPSGLNVL